jgi:hypothetical protein
LPRADEGAYDKADDRQQQLKPKGNVLRKEITSDPDMSIFADDEIGGAWLWQGHEVFLKSLDQGRRHLHKLSVLQLPVLQITGVQDNCPVLIQTLHFGTDEITFLEELAHHAFVFFSSFPLRTTGEIDGRKHQQRVFETTEINFPPLILCEKEEGGFWS